MKIKLPFLILFILVFTYFFGNAVPLPIVSFFYTISFFIKELLVLLLPLVILIFMTSFLVEFSKGVLLFVVALIACIICSNALVTFYSYFFYSAVYPFVIDTTTQLPTLNLESTIKPLLELPIKKIITNNTALLLGLASGVFLGLFFPNNKHIRNWVSKGRSYVIHVLQKLLPPIIPLFVLGFILKLQKDDILEQMIAVYTKVFIVILIAMSVYISFVYLVLAKGRISKALEYMSAFFPATITAFSTMSSMAAYPITLECAQRASKRPHLTQGILTSTVNIHLMGVGIAIPILAITVLMYFGHPFPNFAVFSMFALYLILAKFSVAAIPGGSIMVAVPVLQDHLGFTPEMSALIISLYALVDPFSTATNIFGNGAFSLILTNFLGKLSKTES